MDPWHSDPIHMSASASRREVPILKVRGSFWNALSPFAIFVPGNTYRKPVGVMPGAGASVIGDSTRFFRMRQENFVGAGMLFDLAEAVLHQPKVTAALSATAKLEARKLAARSLDHLAHRPRRGTEWFAGFSLLRPSGRLPTALPQRSYRCQGRHT
jgi:hypothetical protein